MLLLDFGRPARHTAATPLDLVALQRENDELIAELRRQHHRRNIRRIRRLGFFGITIARAAARHSAKQPAKEASRSAPQRKDRRGRTIVLALVLRRILADSSNPNQLDVPSSRGATGPLPTPAEVRS